MKLQEIISERASIEADIEKRTQEHKRHMSDAKKRIQYLDDAEAMFVGGIDIDARERGLLVLGIRGNPLDVKNGFHRDQNRSHVRDTTIKDAAIDIASGCTKIRSRYFGVKNYHRFGDQREDHSYNMGPRHGSIVFSIGLSQSVRDRFRENPEDQLTAQEIEDALYVVSTLKQCSDLLKSA